MAHAPASKHGEGEGAKSPTGNLLDFTENLRWDLLHQDVRHAAKASSPRYGRGHDCRRYRRCCEPRQKLFLATIRPEGSVPVPGRARRADILDAATLGGTGGHGIELDDGYRQGSVHPGVAVVPAIWSAAYGQNISGIKLLEAVIAGYETVTSVARAIHPDLRRRGFHPTGVVGSLGAAIASGRLLGLSRDQLSNAFGLAASSSAGLFAVSGGAGADVKRLHAGSCCARRIVCRIAGERRCGRTAERLGGIRWFLSGLCGREERFPRGVSIFRRQSRSESQIAM